tara:strand:+ start:3003 stop:3872 length:870 start_codon:yes stop_codon:yes gene_type:complete
MIKVVKTRIAQQCPCCMNDDISSSPAVLMPFISHRAFNWKPVQIDETWGLSTIKNGNAYSLCNSLFCNRCGFLFLDIRFSSDELSRLYENYRGEEYTKLRDNYEPGYADRNKNLNSGQKYTEDIHTFLEPHLKFPISILDWGGDTGINTPFKKRNTQLDIYDINGKDVIDGAKIVTKEQAYENKYDLIVCSNVLEHVSYPHELLEEIIPSMDKSSILYIEVPYEDLVINEKNDLHTKKRHWHEHVNFYSKKSLEYLAENAGLKIVDISELEVNDGSKIYYLFQLACKLK